MTEWDEKEQYLLFIKLLADLIQEEVNKRNAEQIAS
ncbi:hypothetical protein JOD01_003425 [Brevibacillus fulvus]|uniref:Uncharacterized protein n=1 Tax=Brevibacillus fulvus TaxID=1125967 RepID=A0A938XWH1_9BACL|nr:hypothetical protein [Brevibacillus fulvus]